MANSFLNFAFSLVALSALSFLGLGVPLNTPDWGGMLSQNLSLIQSNAVASLAPAVAIVLTATSMNLIGDWIYERLSDRGRAR
jgi:peptide/nickel transport system permease protein